MGHPVRTWLRWSQTHAMMGALGEAKESRYHEE